MSTMITFAANNEFFRKRKRVHRACESCKKRRKRCSHTFDEDTDTGSSTKSGQSGANPFNDLQGYQPNHHHPDARLPHPDAPVHRHAHSPMAPQSPPEDSQASTPTINHLGYLNPEAVLREQVNSVHDRGRAAASPIGAPLGHWIPGREDFGDAALGVQSGNPPSRLNETSPQTTPEVAVQKALQAYLDAVRVSILPPREHQDGLLRIYYTYVQPLLPIVDRNLFSARFDQGAEPRMLMQAICIVASKHGHATPHLTLGDDPRLLSPREFSQRLYNAVIAGLEAKVEKNRVVLIQVLALISLHSEGPDGTEQASMHLAQAIHHAHTFGLQFGHQWKNQRSDSGENLEDLFWCLWSLDKINACMNGRPLIMHDRDNSLTKLPTDPEKRSSPFGVWLQISEMLDKVIDYYRPGRSTEETGWEGDDFLGFEEMVGDGEDKLPPPIMIKSTPSYVRQSLSATRVISLLNTEAPELLPPLPIVPYALSVALSVVYRHFRQRRLKVHINRATDELKQCVILLNRLRNAWWSAGTMADLGTAVLNNADRNTRAANTPATVTEHNQQPLESELRPTMTSPTRPTQWQQSPLDSSIDPRLQSTQPPTPMSAIINNLPTPGQHPTSSERAPLSGFDFSDPPETWMNLDTAFENFACLLGSSGADYSNELFKPWNSEGMDFMDSIN